jgi:hypothetical protein
MVPKLIDIRFYNLILFFNNNFVLDYYWLLNTSILLIFDVIYLRQPSVFMLSEPFISIFRHHLPSQCKSACQFNIVWGKFNDLAIHSDAS